MMVLLRTLWIAFVALLIASLAGLPLDPEAVLLLGGVAIVCGLLLQRRDAREHARREPPSPVEVEPPVEGRWTALNSPADKVPSHGTHGYGQTYAIDIVAEPELPSADGEPGGGTDGAGMPGVGTSSGGVDGDGTSGAGTGDGGTGGGGTREGAAPTTRPGFRWLWPLVRRNSAYPAFGAPLFAVADATVVRVADGQRDHLSRSSLPMVLYLALVEGALRDLAGPSRIYGNHLVLDLGDGVYAVYAHVRRGSFTVRPGDRVRAGERVGACGNSGNSSEPHVHFHLMDGLDPDTARGIPFRWRGVGLPANNESFTAARPAAPSTAHGPAQ